ncbi:MAG: VacJ family lipoprotein [Proteobacteria bacterium]|nr:VacJ family lipoprotein [Pseudomonadota bacterium]
MCAGLLLLGGCAGVPADKPGQDAYYEANDPIEPFNRAIFSLNKGLDAVLFKPAATLYRDALPQTLRDGIRNFLNNLKSPVILANNLLQGDFDAAIVTVSRFTTNTIIGLGGFGNPAGDLGAKFRDEDFGQTLAVWGVGEGPYLVLPIFGPSNPRDTTGLVVDTLIDPVNMWADNTDRGAVQVVRTLVRGLDERSRYLKTLDDLEKSSLDFYVTMRSLYRQLRNDSIRNGGSYDPIPTPSISLDEDEQLLGPRAGLLK